MLSFSTHLLLQKSNPSGSPSLKMQQKSSMRKAEPGRKMKPDEVWMLPIEQLLNNSCLTLVSADQRDPPDLSNRGTRSRVERLLPCQAKATRLILLTRRSSSSGTAAGAHPADLHAAGVKTPQFFRKSYQVAHST